MWCLFCDLLSYSLSPYTHRQTILIHLGQLFQIWGLQADSHGVLLGKILILLFRTEMDLYYILLKYLGMFLYWIFLSSLQMSFSFWMIRPRQMPT